MLKIISKIEIESETYQDIIKHLKNAINDPRERERKRAKIALLTIQKWYKKNES